MFAWRGVGGGRHFAKSTQGRQNQVGPPGVQNPGYAPEHVNHNLMFEEKGF